MILKDLTLHDFRTYGGRQTIQLAPKGEDQPIILIGGLNGAGKTTLLDALQLVLYGQRAQCAGRGDMSYKAYLRQAIHRRADVSEGASVELSFAHAREGQVHDYHIRRSWYATASSVRERIEVDVDGAFDPVLTEQWDERVDDFAPHRISQLFFFDGEKIKELAEQESSADVLKVAIHSLLGLELVDRLSKDLSILDQKKRRSGEIDFDRARIEQLSEERQAHEVGNRASAEECSHIRRKLDQSEQLLAKYEDRYRGEGGELADQRATLEAERASLAVAVADRRELMRELTLGCLPLASIQGLLANVDEQAHHEEGSRLQSMVSDILENRDSELLSKLRKAAVPDSSLAQFEQLLESDRVHRKSQQGEAGYLELAPDDVRELDRLVKSELPASIAQARTIGAELDQYEEKLIVLDRKLESIPEEGDLAILRDQRSAALEEVELYRVKLKVEAENHESLKRKYLASSDGLARELARELAAAQSNEGLHRKLDRIAVASEVLEGFRSQVLTSNLGRVEAAVLDSFHNLIGKSNLVGGLKIDPESFSLKLIGGDGKVLEREALSAGEKQLLAIAILWGLASTSGLPLPVVIDTPLGRLDSVHRRHLMDRYFPHASHQVLLLSTDEEIREGRLTELQPHIGRSYLLEYLPDEDRTVVREGYFQH